MGDLNDKEATIAAKLRTGDPSLREELYGAYAGYLTGVCTRYISEHDYAKDVLHDSFLKIFSSISNFHYRGPGSLKAWLTRIVVNESLKFIKREYSSLFVHLSDDGSDFPAEEEPELSGLRMKEIHALIRELPVGYRTVFNLYVFEEKSHKEISRLLNIKESSSASQLHRAKALLAEKIKNYLSLKYGGYGR